MTSDERVTITVTFGWTNSGEKSYEAERRGLLIEDLDEMMDRFSGMTYEVSAEVES